MNQSVEVEEQTGSTKPQHATDVSGSTEGSELLVRKVLVVDDEASVLSSLRRLLRRESYELVTADSGEEALRMLEAQRIQVVMADQRMPSMTGIELLGEVRRRWPDTIRMILSGYSAVQTIIEAINEGAVYKFLSKPWNDEELKGNVRQALVQYGLLAENRQMSRQIAEQNERLQEMNEALNQRASDATAGLSSIQDLQDAIAVGLVTFDDCGLIVAANRLAGQMLASGADLFGMPAVEVLPNDVYQAFFPGGTSGEKGTSGRMDHGGRKMQWRLDPVRSGDARRGLVATIWEDVQ